MRGYFYRFALRIHCNYPPKRIVAASGEFVTSHDLGSECSYTVGVDSTGKVVEMKCIALNVMSNCACRS